MKVILTTNIKKLGKIGDSVSVKPGYARNFLFPNKMALRENKKNNDYYEKIKDEIKINEENKLLKAKELIDKIKNTKITFNKEADEKGQLYGSISKKEIIEFLHNKDIKIKSDDLLIKQQIKIIGDHKIEISPYEDVTEEVTVFVHKK